MNSIHTITDVLLTEKSIIAMIDEKINELTDELNKTYGSIEEYLNQQW